ncbi:MAG: hypothetical protein K6A34_08750 [Methanobrevibacter sp.]|nr:hypothetical protein [Methanobrevibacter sp.]
MSDDLVSEIEYMIDLLTKSGFFSAEEILEILEDQFIEEEVDFSKFDISLNSFDNHNFQKLEETFKKLAEKSIVAVHNCGYDFEEGVEDIFELYAHLFNNKYQAQGFCFYTFEDVEEAISDEILRITFGDFQRSEDASLEIGKIVYNQLVGSGFDVEWNGSVNSQIEIQNFKWDKRFDDEKEYELEGAYDLFVGVVNEE